MEAKRMGHLRKSLLDAMEAKRMGGSAYLKNVLPFAVATVQIVVYYESRKRELKI